MFVSSTLTELAAERKAARRAIERLSAAPVMFETGARPHPPRSLYRAYLAQSDIFVGIYWNRYGWVAPGEAVSGLEDEYNLAPAEMPKLIYVKTTEGTRDQALTELLDRIRDDDTASYKHFADAKELARLLVADLAVLLAERFDDSRRQPALKARPQAPESQPAAIGEPSTLPESLNPLLGREEDIERLAELVTSPGTRLVTLTGPGGVGKTRLAVELARRIESEFSDGILFVPLASVHDAAQVPSAIARALGVNDDGGAPVEAKLVISLRHRRMLLVLDNFEQVLPAASVVSTLLAGASDVKAVVTSRVMLRISGEHNYQVAPLRLPDRLSPRHPRDPLASSVELFIQRAQSVQPDFLPTPETMTAVEEIVARLEGLPLAIELAAARVRLLTPPELLRRLDRQLALLVGGQRDAPSRQQTVRNTIEWSTRLLAQNEQNVLWRLGAFTGSFSLEAAEAVAGPDTDVLGPLEALIDASLVRHEDRDGRTYLQLLVNVREYALERLTALGEYDHARLQHAQYYRRWAERVSGELTGARQRDLLTALDDERENLLSAQRYLLESGDWRSAADFMWNLFAYWALGGMMAQARGWAETMLSAGEHLPQRAVAMALGLRNARLLWETPTPEIIAGLEQSAALFESLDHPEDTDAISSFVSVVYSTLAQAYFLSPEPDFTKAEAAIQRGFDAYRKLTNRWGEVILVLTAGALEAVRGDTEAAAKRFDEGLRRADAGQDGVSRGLALDYLGWLNLERGSLREAATYFERELHNALPIRSRQGISMVLEGALAIAARRGDAERAGMLAGAAEARREQHGQAALTERSGTVQPIDQLRGGLLLSTFEGARRRGRGMPLEQVLGIARDVLAETIDKDVSDTAQLEANRV
ncbi:DUF4062 domain-containing protein [Naasia sp. SYSU D00948]|uniref:DUF4062 domain-containing protein n=1 Tax=Naasia sp. SYSU D00948 TaxID=2817379 RepID=UPI001B306EBE|nr:DUF4062 domain-containing protein [Naasia sp. SYSU D00948]